MTIEFVEGFHELMLPAHSYDNLWTACGSDESMYYLLNGDRPHLCDLDEIDFDEIKPNLYFDTEWDCHYAASEYYLQRLGTYPYMAEWLKCIPRTKVITELESQVMVFK